MDLKCKSKGCSNVYKMAVSGEGKGFVGQIIVMWQCNICRKWNAFSKGELTGGEGVSISLEW